MTAELAVEIRNLTKRFGGNEVVAVQDLNLSVRRGEIYGFLGPNGAGKTTTLRVLLGLARPSAGSAVLLGGAPGDPGSLRRVGAVVETPSFYPYMSGRANLRALAYSTGLSSQRVDEALAEVGLTASAGRKFKTYSMGMKQRLGLGAALMKDPELLILDEPTNGLDPQGVVEMRNLIKEIGRGGRTVMLSSHLLSEVEQTCDRVGVIQAGRLVAEGTIDEIRGQSSKVLLRAAPAEHAQQLLESWLGAGTVTQSEGVLEVTVDPARAGELNSKLVQAGVVVSELRAEQRSLEDVFLQLTAEVPGA